MSRMTTFALLLGILFWAAGGGVANAEREADISQLKVGSHCELATKETVSGNGRTLTIYLGTVKELSKDSVTLEDVTFTTRSDRSPPVLGSIPYIKRLFKNVGIGRSHMGEKSVVIPLKDIVRNETVTADEFRMRSAIRTKNVVRVEADNAQ
jgi:hypothetical protein